MLLVSGNDAANALAQAAAGSEEEFVGEMNDAAARLGLDDTSYANPVGLDEMGNYSSARDLVDLAIELRKDALFREIFDTASTTTETGARPRNLVNRNTLVQTVPYVNGVKTGYTIDAGNVLVGSGKQDGVELVSAVLGAPSEGDRDAATMALLDYGFSLYHRRTPVRAGEPVDRVAITDREAEVVLAPSSDIRITVRKGQSVETRIEAPAEVEGPVEKGERLGSIVVSVDGEAAGRTAADRDRERRFRQPAGALRRGDSGAANRRLGARGRRPRADLRRRRGALGPAAMIGAPGFYAEHLGAGFATHDELLGARLARPAAALARRFDLFRGLALGLLARRGPGMALIRRERGTLPALAVCALPPARRRAFVLELVRRPPPASAWRRALVRLWGAAVEAPLMRRAAAGAQTMTAWEADEIAHRAGARPRPRPPRALGPVRDRDHAACRDLPGIAGGVRVRAHRVRLADPVRGR